MKWSGRLLASAQPRRRDPVSIWSVDARDARMFFRLAGALWLAAVVFIVYTSLQDASSGTPRPAAWRTAGDFALAALADFGSVALPVAVLSMLLARAAKTLGEMLMSLYQVVVNRFVVPVIEAHKAEGRKEGRVEGRTEVMEEWRAWNGRRLAAEGEGREFAEPPPGERSVQAG